MLFASKMRIYFDITGKQPPQPTYNQRKLRQWFFKTIGMFGKTHQQIRNTQRRCSQDKQANKIAIDKWNRACSDTMNNQRTGRGQMQQISRNTRQETLLAQANPNQTGCLQ